MSDSCEVTGLSPENVNKFQYLHSHLKNSLEISEPSSDALVGFSKPLQYTVSNHRIHNSDMRAYSLLRDH